MDHEGGCQCGRIRYRAAGAPNLASICHCRMCQRASGGPFMVFVRFAVEQVTWSTQPELFASSNLAERAFCKACGTPLSYHAIGGPNVSLTRNSLDDPDAVLVPEMSLASERRAGWLAGLATLPDVVDDRTTDPAFRSHQR